MAAAITEEYQDTISKFLQTLSNFDQAEFNSSPAAGGWSPAQVGDHILKSLTGVPANLTGSSAAADRDPAEKEPMIKKVFLDFTTKLNSPAFIIPTDEPLDKTTLINSLSNVSADILKAYQSHNPNEVCLEFGLPAMGNLTRLEWLYFITYHTKRHIWQLEKMAA